jgi:predicted small secreted protein
MLERSLGRVRQIEAKRCAPCTLLVSFWQRRTGQHLASLTHQSWHGKTMKKIATLAMAVILAACGNTNNGNEFVGRWVDTDSGASMITIERNDKDFLVITSNPKTPNVRPDAPVPAVLKEGKLVMESSMGAPTLTYVKAKDNVIFGSVAGSAEYHRVK